MRCASLGWIAPLFSSLACTSTAVVSNSAVTVHASARFFWVSLHFSMWRMPLSSSSRLSARSFAAAVDTISRSRFMSRRVPPHRPEFSSTCIRSPSPRSSRSDSSVSSRICDARRSPAFGLLRFGRRRYGLRSRMRLRFVSAIASSRRRSISFVAVLLSGRTRGNALGPPLLGKFSGGRSSCWVQRLQCGSRWWVQRCSGGQAASRSRRPARNPSREPSSFAIRSQGDRTGLTLPLV